MAQGGILGSGVKVGYSATSPVTWLPLGQILNVDAPGLNPDEVETTIHGTSNYKRFMRGLIDVSEMAVTLLADLNQVTSVDQAALFTLQGAGTTVWWRVEIPTDRTRSAYTALEFQGWVKKWDPQTPIAGRQELNISVRFDGNSFSKYPSGASAM